MRTIRYLLALLLVTSFSLLSPIARGNDTIVALEKRAAADGSQPSDTLSKALQEQSIAAGSDYLAKAKNAKVRDKGVLLDKALKEFQFALALNRENAAAVSGQGEILVETRQYDDALKCFTRAAALEPGNTEYMVNQAYAYYMLRDYAKAVEIYEAVMKLNPSN